jgi:hypothetical protein
LRATLSNLCRLLTRAPAYIPALPLPVENLPVPAGA